MNIYKQTIKPWKLSLSFIICLLACFNAHALPKKAPAPFSDIKVQVWLNEAIVSTYSFTYDNFIQQQKTAARYFTSKGWLAYSKALDKSGLMGVIKAQKYTVSAVATLPPTITKQELIAGQYIWHVKMPILVYYKNEAHPQKQYLEITTRIFYAPQKKPARPLAIDSFYAKKMDPPDCPKNNTQKK